MKQITVLAVLAALFFGTLASVSALPPLQFYVRWDTPVLYTCTHSHGQSEMAVALTHLDYEAPQTALMTETDITDNSFGHFVTSQDDESGWMNLSGTRKHTTYTVDSASYPITLRVVLKTYINNAQVYESTFTARCTGNSHGTLSAAVNNNDNPLNFEVRQEGDITYNPP